MGLCVCYWSIFKAGIFYLLKVYEIVYLSLYHSAIPQVTGLFLIPQTLKSLLSGSFWSSYCVYYHSYKFCHLRFSFLSHREKLWDFFFYCNDHLVFKNFHLDLVKSPIISKETWMTYNFCLKRYNQKSLPISMLTNTKHIDPCWHLNMQLKERGSIRTKLTNT